MTQMTQITETTENQATDELLVTPEITQENSPQISSNDEIRIQKVEVNRANLAIIGRAPFLFNRVQEKAKRQLLEGATRKTKTERESVLKHDPISEFRNSVYRFAPSEQAPTRLGFPASAFKQAMMSAALEVPGINRTTISRLVIVREGLFPMWGIPRLHMDIVRSAGINRTPDVRTWAMLPEWVTIIAVDFVYPQLNETSIVNLLHAAGVFIGVGDGRNEKGKKSFGQFEITNFNDPEFQRIMKMDRQAQDAALENPVAYSPETEEMLQDFFETVRRRGRQKQLDAAPGEALDLI